MKKISFMIISACVALVTSAQQKEGKVIYERTAQMTARSMVMNGVDMAAHIPKSRTDKFELTFGNNQSIWKHVEEDNAQEDMSGGGGMQIRMSMAGANDVVFHDFSNAKKVEQREMFDKKFIVSDSIRKLSWKITGETKIILGHTCQQAIAQRTGMRTQTTMENGKLERREVMDTSNIVAWFTTEIPVSAGPDVQGQLPGLILALDINNGRLVYRALEIQPKADIATIKEPTKGKKVTADEFTKERDKMMEEMQKNNQGGGRTIIRM
jgi:GLPGLI family protein